MCEVWVRLYYEYHTDITVGGTSGTMLRPIRTQAWVVRKDPQIVYDYLKLWQGGLGPHYTNYNGTGHLGNAFEKDQQDVYSVVDGTTYTVNGKNSYCWWHLTGFHDFFSATVSAESETKFHRGGSNWTLRATISKGNPM